MNKLKQLQIRFKKIFFAFIFLTLAHFTQAEVIYEDALHGEEFQMGNLLSWSTAEEENSSIFIVERSIDGENFEQIGNVEAAGIALETKNYNFLDISINAEKAFYRLRQTDTDGTASFSHIVQVNKQWSNNFTLLTMNGTEVNKQFECTIDARVNAQLQIALFSYEEELLFEDKIALTNGLNDVYIPMDVTPAGIYKIRLRVGNEVELLTIHKVDDETKKTMNASTKSTKRGG